MERIGFKMVVINREDMVCLKEGNTKALQDASAALKAAMEGFSFPTGTGAAPLPSAPAPVKGNSYNDKMNKYCRMIANGIPEGAVRQKMTQDGIPAETPLPKPPCNTTSTTNAGNPFAGRALKKTVVEKEEPVKEEKPEDPFLKALRLRQEQRVKEGRVKPEDSKEAVKPTRFIKKEIMDAADKKLKDQQKRLIVAKDQERIKIINKAIAEAQEAYNKAKQEFNFASEKKDPVYLLEKGLSLSIVENFIDKSKLKSDEIIVMFDFDGTLTQKTGVTVNARGGDATRNMITNLNTKGIKWYINTAAPPGGLGSMVGQMETTLKIPLSSTKIYPEQPECKKGANSTSYKADMIESNTYGVCNNMISHKDKEKDKAAEFILSKLTTQPKLVIFVDDSYMNVYTMYKYFENKEGIQFIGILYEPYSSVVEAGQEQALLAFAEDEILILPIKDSQVNLPNVPSKEEKKKAKEKVEKDKQEALKKAAVKAAEERLARVKARFEKNRGTTRETGTKVSLNAAQKVLNDLSQKGGRKTRRNRRNRRRTRRN